MQKKIKILKKILILKNQRKDWKVDNTYLIFLKILKKLFLNLKKKFNSPKMLKIIDITLSTKIITNKCVGAFNQLSVIPQSSYK